MEIWTIGYEKASWADIQRLLQGAGIECLVDVRQLPQSRRAGFSRGQLQAGLEALGIEYRHMRPLGTPKEGRVAHRGGDFAAFEAIVLKQLATAEAQDALAELSALATARRSCLLCFEADWRHCHRRMIVDALSTRQDLAAHHLEVEPSFL